MLPQSQIDIIINAVLMVYTKRIWVKILHVSAGILMCLMFTACTFSVQSKKKSPSQSDTIFVSESIIDSVKSISIVFAGDLMQHLQQIKAAQNPNSDTYNFKPCFKYISPFFHTSDLVVVNLETTLSDTPPYSGYPAFCAPSQLAADIKESGVDIVLLANNHICDKGSSGILKTITALDNAGIYHTGAFSDSIQYMTNNPLTIYRNGYQISILNYTYGTNGLDIPTGRIVNLIDTTAMSRDLTLIKPDEKNLTFVCLHWGEEYNTLQNNDQSMLARWLASKGVDFIIGSHPHVIQPFGQYHDHTGQTVVKTLYSLGNFVSNQSRLNTDGGMVLRLNITKSNGRPAEITPEYFFVWTYRPLEEGTKRYYVIPTYDADSLLCDDRTDALKNCNIFVEHARKIIGNEHAHNEITEFSSLHYFKGLRIE